MKFYDWNDEKNELLKESRGISFESLLSQSKIGVSEASAQSHIAGAAEV